MRQDLLQDLMTIQIEGPDFCQYNLEPAIEAWLTGGQKSRHNLHYADPVADSQESVGMELIAYDRLATINME